MEWVEAGQEGKVGASLDARGEPGQGLLAGE